MKKVRGVPTTRPGWYARAWDRGGRPRWRTRLPLSVVAWPDEFAIRAFLPTNHPTSSPISRPCNGLTSSPPAQARMPPEHRRSGRALLEATSLSPQPSQLDPSSCRQSPTAARRPPGHSDEPVTGRPRAVNPKEQRRSSSRTQHEPGRLDSAPRQLVRSRGGRAPAAPIRLHRASSQQYRVNVLMGYHLRFPAV
jgi:hypothetical protein